MDFTDKNEKFQVDGNDLRHDGFVRLIKDVLYGKIHVVKYKIWDVQ